MCQDEIGKVRRVDHPVGAAVVSFGGIDREISLLALDEGVLLDEGDWVVSYQGYALAVMDEPTAAELLRERADAGVAGVAGVAGAGDTTEPEETS